MKATVRLPILIILLSSPIGFAQTHTSGDWVYTLISSNEAAIIGYVGPGGAVTIPSTVDDNLVTQLGTWADTGTTARMGTSIFAKEGVRHGEYNMSVTSVVIPDSVTRIGKGAFKSCKSLASVSIGNGVQKIGDYAFFDCDALTSVTIPDSVKSIGTHAFAYCRALTSVRIGNGVTEIGWAALEVCPRLTSVTIPRSLSEKITQAVIRPQATIIFTDSDGTSDEAPR